MKRQSFEAFHLKKGDESGVSLGTISDPLSAVKMKAKKLLEMPIFRVYFIPKMQLFLFMCFTRASAKKIENTRKSTNQFQAQIVRRER